MPQPPQFVDTNVVQITNDVINRFQELTGRVLQPAHVERLLLNVLAYREQLVREQIQYSATQNLVSFADGIALDYLGELVGVNRLASSPATCTLQFTLVSGHGGSIVPAGTRVSSDDGKAIFITLEDLVVAAEDSTGQVVAEATVPGIVGNGYIAGDVSSLMDPLAYVSAVANLAETGGGNPEETDDQLRERIMLAPGQFSNAGSREAYQFFSRSANPSIIDVAVESNDPGTVQIYPLMADGNTTPTEVLDQVFAACNDERVRPLTDEVTVISPTAVTYTLEIELVVYAWADETDTLAAATAAVEALILAKRQKLGQDVPASQVYAAASVEGVFSVTLVGFTDVVVEANEVAKNTALVITVTGTQDE